MSDANPLQNVDSVPPNRVTVQASPAKPVRRGLLSRELVASSILNSLDEFSVPTALLCDASADFGFQAVNLPFESLFGYHREEIAGLPLGLIAADADGFDGKHDITHLRCRRKNGTLVNAQIVLCPLQPSPGVTPRVLAIFTDMSQEEHSQRRIHLMQERLYQIVREGSRRLKYKNIAIREMMMQLESERKNFQNQITTNLQERILPMITRLRTRVDLSERHNIDQLRRALEELGSSFGSTLGSQKLNLTPREVEICHLVRGGLSTKELAEYFHVSISTMENHRSHIRHKLGISGHDANLVTFLRSLTP